MRVVTLLPILFGVTLLACQRDTTERSPAAPTRTLRLVHTWGSSLVGAERMRVALAESGVPVQLSLTLSATAVRMLQNDEIDAAFTYSNIAYSASSEQLRGSAPAVDHIRAIAELPPRAVQVVVGPHSGITSMSELRGRHVSLGAVGGSAAQTAELVLRAYGISPSDVIAEHFELGDAARKIVSGELDAVFSNGFPNPDLAEATRQGARILEVVGSEINRFRMTYPLLKPTVIQSGTYPGIDHPIHTVGIDGIFICRTNLDEGTVYQLTRAVIEAAAREDLGVEALKRMTLSAASSTAIPLHHGAARYYRGERELLP